MEEPSPIEPASTKRSRKTVIVITVIATLACVYIFEGAWSTAGRSDYEARAKRSAALLTAQEQRAQKYDEYYQRLEADQKRYQALQDRQEQSLVRFDKILDTWERQQREYQTYLDSLKTKRQ
jgi:hypothetical protein